MSRNSYAITGETALKHSARTLKYRKDEMQERLLRDLNTHLQSVEERLTADLQEPTLPIIFIIGPPRSATTPVSQLLAHWGGFAYISNFVARFWLAPSVGVMIEQSLNIRTLSTDSRYSSEYGVTKGWAEPHEFGYFWDRWFDLGQETHKLTNEELRKVDVIGLKRSVAAIEGSYGQPLVFKNNTWCTFQVEFLAKVFPKSVFVVCERNPLYIAQSILIGRQERLGSRELWWSVRPKEYPSLLKLPWWEQIAGQVYHTIQDMEEGVRRIPNERIVRVKYQALCDNPTRIARQVATAVNRLGANVPQNGTAPENFTPTNVQRAKGGDFQKLRGAVKRYFATEPVHKQESISDQSVEQ